MNTKWLDDLFYFLLKDYGTRIVYTRIGKADINYDTGVRTDVKDSNEIDAVLAPIGLYAQYLKTLIGSVNRAKSMFLVRKSDIPFEPSPEDYFIHDNKRYRQLEFEDYITLYVVSGLATVDALTYNVVTLPVYDNIGLNDGV